MEKVYVLIRINSDFETVTPLAVFRKKEDLVSGIAQYAEKHGKDAYWNYFNEGFVIVYTGDGFDGAYPLLWFEAPLN